MQVYYPDVNATKSAATNYLDRAPANLSDVLAEEFVSGARFGVDALNAIGTRIESVFEDAKLTQEEYENSEYFREGINVPEGGINVSIAQLSAEAYDRRFARNLTLNRARQGISTGALRFTANLAGSIFDPLNIAAGMLAPVAIGANATARAASARAVSGITNRYGVSAGRVAAGVGEGAVGALAFEPAALYASTIVQDPEYGLFDSFVNLTAGAIFGGVLTGVGGKFSDKIKNARLETQSQAIRTAISQGIEGRPIDVDAPVVNIDPEIGAAAQAEQRAKDQMTWERLNQPARTKHKGKQINRFPESVRRFFQLATSGPDKGKTRKPQSLSQFIKKIGGISTKDANIGDIRQSLDKRAFQLTRSPEKGGLDLDEIGLRAWEEGFFGVGTERPTVADLLDAIDRDVRSNGSVFSDMDADVKLYEDAVARMEELERFGIDPIDMTDAEIDAELEFRQAAMSDDELATMEQLDQEGLTQQEAESLIVRAEADPDDPSTYIDIYDDASSLQAFEEIRSGNLNKADQQRLKNDDTQLQALNDDIDKMQMQIAALTANNLIPDEELLLLRELDDFINQYEDFDEVAQAGAMCVVEGRKNV